MNIRSEIQETLNQLEIPVYDYIQDDTTITPYIVCKVDVTHESDLEGISYRRPCATIDLYSADPILHDNIEARIVEKMLAVDYVNNYSEVLEKSCYATRLKFISIK